MPSHPHQEQHRPAALLSPFAEVTMLAPESFVCCSLQRETFKNIILLDHRTLCVLWSNNVIFLHKKDVKSAKGEWSVFTIGLYWCKYASYHFSSKMVLMNNRLLVNFVNCICTCKCIFKLKSKNWAGAFSLFSNCVYYWQCGFSKSILLSSLVVSSYHGDFLWPF